MRSWRISRDGAIATAAVLWASYEIVLGGGRPAVLTFLTGLLLSPIVMRVDAARRAQAAPDPDGEANPSSSPRGTP